MKETLSSSERLEQNIQTENIKEFQFRDKQEMVQSLKQIGQEDITEADLLFDGSIQFRNEEYVTLVKKLEQQKIEEKKKILSEVISLKTAGKVNKLKTDIDAEKRKIKEALSDLAPEKIITSAKIIEKLIDFVSDSAQKQILRSYAGSIILETLEKHNERIIINADKIITIDYINPISPANTELDANKIALEKSLNETIQKTSSLLDTIRSGILLRSQVETADKNNNTQTIIVKPISSQEDMQAYFKKLEEKKTKNESLTIQEETFLLSQEGFKDFQSFAKPQDVAKLAQKVSTDTSVLSTSQFTGDKMTSSVGEWIGQIGGTIGKIAAAGAGGGIKALGDILASATKEGGAWGSLAVIGGLIAAIWKFGFWKTLGGVFGLGLANEAVAGRLDLDFGKKSGDRASTAGKPAPSPEKLGTVQSEQIIQTKTEVRQDVTIQTIEQTKFDAIFDGISTSLDFKNQPIRALEKALEWGTTGSLELLFGNIEHIGNMTGKEFYEKHGQEDIRKILDSLMTKKESSDVTLSDLFVKTSPVAVAVSSVVAEVSTTNETVPTTPEGMEQLATSLEIQGYSSLYILTRAIEFGFIPKTHDLAFKDGTNSAKTATWKWIWYKIDYVTMGGPLTNGTFDSASKANNWFNEYVARVLKADVLLEKTEIQSLLSSPKKLSSIDTHDLKERMKVLNELDIAFFTGGDKTKIQKLLFEYKELSGDNLKSLLRKYDVKTYTETIWLEKESVEYKKQQIDQINKEIIALKEEAKTKLTEFNKLAGKDPTKAEFYKKEGERIIQEINGKITALETNGIKNLQKLDPEAIKKLAQQSPWVENLVKANGGADNLAKKLIETKIGKITIGTALLAIAWDSRDAWGDIWNKGISKENMKTTIDLALGFVPVIGGAHDLMIANNDWYKKLLFGDRELSTEEMVARDAFWAVGLIPWVGTLVKVVGKWSAKVVNGATIAMEGVKLTGKGVTYGYLGYTLEEAVRHTTVDIYDRIS